MFLSSMFPWQLFFWCGNKNSVKCAKCGITLGPTNVTKNCFVLSTVFFSAPDFLSPELLQHSVNTAFRMWKEVSLEWHCTLKERREESLGVCARQSQNATCKRVRKNVAFWSGPQIKLFSAWTAGRRMKLRKWWKSKWKNDFPFWVLSQWREKAMGRLHGYLSGWGQSMPVVAAHYKTLPIYPLLSLPSTAGQGLLCQIT